MSRYDAWLAGGARTPVQLDGSHFEVFVRTGGNGGWCTLLHGFPTSSFDWHHAWDALAREHRLLAFDFLGFGDSDKPVEHAYSIHEQADLAERIWQRHGVERTVLLVHDYGVSVAQELLARQRDGALAVDIERAVFLNGGLYPELHRPQPGQLMLLDPETGPQIGKLMNADTFGNSLRPTFSPGHPPSPQDLAGAWASVERRGGPAVAHLLIRYIRDREAHRDRWVDALERSDVPRAFVWGMLDPVSGAHMAERIAIGLPDAELVRLGDIAHWPQLEAPDVVVPHLLRLLR
ncbi:MAG: alpha/beta hydrolase [Deltaproteobacteria bacterium]|nr:alpha/beta hydrolase [Deltaproteobacteria bacterium]